MTDDLEDYWLEAPKRSRRVNWLGALCQGEVMRLATSTLVPSLPLPVTHAKSVLEHFISVFDRHEHDQSDCHSTLEHLYLCSTSTSTTSSAATAT